MSLPSTIPLGVCLALLIVGCVPENPAVNAPPNNSMVTAGEFADTVLVYTMGATTVSCVGSGIPVCGGTQTQGGSCASNPALGVNDGSSFTVQPLSRIELGFVCRTIVEVGLVPGVPGASNDFKIFGSVVGNAVPAVEVGDDGSAYQTVNPWPKANGAYVNDPGFQLEAANVASARWVRIAEVSGQGSLQIDALQALPRPQ
jgi:hypothetical protein